MSTSSTKQRRWFALKLAIFALPILCLLLGLFFSAWIIGETRLPSQHFAQPYDAPGLYEPTWDRLGTITFKLQGALQRQPDVLLLGSSRDLFARGEMFVQQPDAFFNAAFPAAAPAEMRGIVEVLAAEDSMPGVLLIALDFPHFNAERVAFLRNDRSVNIRLVQRMDQRQLVDGLRTVGWRWLHKPKETFAHLSYNLSSERPLFGVVAWNHDQGFRPDGSHYRGVLQDTANTAARIAGHEEELANRQEMYEVGFMVDEAQIAEIASILEMAQQHGTAVVGFLPPYRTAFYETIFAETEDYAYIPLTIQHLQALFASYDYPLYDYSDLQDVGGQDDEMYDGWHPGERLMGRIILALAEANPDILGAYVDPLALARDIEQADDPFFYYVPRR